VLDQLTLTGSSIAGRLQAKSLSDGKQLELEIKSGHYFAPEQEKINSNTPVGGALVYTVHKKHQTESFTLKSAHITIHYLAATESEVKLKLTVPKAEQKENAKDISEFVYSVTKATKKFKDTKAQGNKLIKFAELWPDISNLPSSGEFRGTFS
jgi:hypothetical protein